MSPPTFTVVIPAYNERELVPGAIRSVQRQTLTDWEAIVVDDGSTDGTAEVVRPIAKQDPRVRVVSKENGGLSAARNTGIEQSEGGYVSFLDADDLWLPRYLELMGAALDAAPEAGFAYTDAWAMSDNGRFRRKTAMSINNPPAHPPADREAFLELLARANFIFVSTTVRREALRAAGPFDVTLTSCEDYDMWLRILGSGYAAVRSPGVLAIKRERSDAMSENNLRMVENLTEVCRRVSANADLPERVRAVAENRLSALARLRSALRGETASAALALRLRRMLGSFRRATVGRFDWRRDPPADLQEVLRELDPGRSEP